MDIKYSSKSELTTILDKKQTILEATAFAANSFSILSDFTII